jgi:hypothetical protein
MSEVAVNQLKHDIESQHGCTATFAQSVPVKETFEGETVWGWCGASFYDPRTSQG